MSRPENISSFAPTVDNARPIPQRNAIDDLTGNPIDYSVDDSIDRVIAAEIRIEQSVHTQGAMPVLLAGNAIAVMIVFVTSPIVALSSNAIIFEIALLAMLLPMLRSYLRLRHLPRPQSVSRRRIRTLEV